MYIHLPGCISATNQTQAYKIDSRQGYEQDYECKQTVNVHSLKLDPVLWSKRELWNIASMLNSIYSNLLTSLTGCVVYIQLGWSQIDVVIFEVTVSLTVLFAIELSACFRVC